MQYIVNAFSPENFIWMLVATVIGIVVGAIPGLGPVFALSIFLPMTFSMSNATSLIFLAALYGSCVFGGSISSILINTPGTAGNVATCFDGYAMARKGQSGKALGISVTASLIGGLIGVMVLQFFGPVLGAFSLKLGPAENFMLAVAGLSLVALSSKGSTLRGLIMGCLGIMVAFIGRSTVTGVKRFVFGTYFLEDGLKFVPISIGLFSLAQAMVLVGDTSQFDAENEKITSLFDGMKEVLIRPITTIKNAIIGTVLGIVPGVGINASSFIAYVLEKSTASEEEKKEFGNGSVKGILAPEAANNACTMGALIPAFGLGIPGSSSAALFLSAMMIHGLEPGAEFYADKEMFYTVIVGMYAANFAFFIIGSALCGVFAKVIKVKNTILAPAIGVLCIAGAFAYRNSILDVLVMLVSAVFGYIFIKLEWPVASLILGLILGNMMEENFNRCMIMSDNTMSIIFQKPISLALLIIIVLSFCLPVIMKLLKERGKSWKAENV